MRKLIVISLLLFFTSFAWSQEDIVVKTRQQIDSILQLIKKEKDPDKRFAQVIAIYGTASEGFPVLMFESYQKLYLIGKESNDLIAESSAWSFAGQAYRLGGDYIKALECHHKAITLAEQSGNYSLLGYAQNQMAHIYKDRDETEKALQLYKTAAANVAKGRIESLNMWPVMNLGAVYFNADQLDTSLAYSEKALAYNMANRDEGYKDYLLANIGGVYSKKADYKKATPYFTQAVQYAEQSKSARFMNNTYQATAEHFYRFNMIDSASFYAKKAISIVQGTIMNNLALKPAKLLMDIYEKSNADSTLKYLRVYRVANDSLYNVRANQQLQMMTFEEDQRQRDLATEKINYQTKLKTNLLIGGLIAFSAIALILFRNNKLKQKTNKKLEETLEDLKATQAQLIQSEKMASLGELTAGIAHEIQNPLNFVNNFSEVSAELIEEVKSQKEKLATDEFNEILDDIDGNLKKILHHGKRADTIVKSMLQHSRASTDRKEPVNLNELADEYLRLSYHGLRAKDKSFNANIQKEFDKSIGNINIIPQDIGRVIMNLLTNAFYAVNEKKQQSGEKYQPTVTIRTKKKDNLVVLSVTDNGNGIPEKVVEKIFQPFFTTKPTGQGTGLGLSLSYDIIKAHGGRIIVSPHEKTGTTFVVELPLNQLPA
ncbi:ATP-binding protein [Terrimonas sp. NA20]|uniref:histidine kinase n=1 Tax=Terrimonas ginsenosidimutans TaxID=2908004 RepID=A0ABS9KLT4_9BACT|nr:ATP-binding protein [Terrimonas ginsenosidimutans]MCG2613283.1 ATP-binding protein [Terrimonas ginsenosidimutans]